MLLTGWGGLPLITGGQSRAINGENPRGEKREGRNGRQQFGAFPEGLSLPERDSVRGDRRAGRD